MDDPMDVDEEFSVEESVNPHHLPSDRPNIMHNHYYHAPVHYIGQAQNTSFGGNYGFIAQTSHNSTHRFQPVVLDRSILQRSIQQPLLSHNFLSALNPILDASHTRNLKVSPPHSRCLPGTREKVISMIFTWATIELSESDPHILWIYAYAGCGKSAISQAIAEQLAGEGRLAASFFFFRSSGDRSRLTRFVTTLACQLAHAIPATASIIQDAIRRDPRLLSPTTTSLSNQFERLVCQPIKAVAASLKNGPLTIVLDGVDECEDRQEVSFFIKHMINYFDKDRSTPLRFVIASRVEDHLHQELHASLQVRLLDLVSHTSDADIEAALDASLAREKQNNAMVYDDNWLSSENKQRLVKHIGGSYIFMSTILNEIFKPPIRNGLAPMDRLTPILSASPDFDGLYMSLLQPLRRLPHFLDIIGTIALAREAISIAQIAELLEVRTVDIVTILVNLDSIIQFPGDDRSPVTFWHTSLRDFLTSEERAGPFFTAPEFHRRLAYRCIALAQGSSPSQCYEYSRHFAMEHLVKFVNSVDDNTDPFGGEGDHIMRLLEKPVFKRIPWALESGLEVACRMGEWKVVRALVDANIDLNAKFQWLDDEDWCIYALHAACYAEKIDMVMHMLDKGADPNVVDKELSFCYCWSIYGVALIWAVRTGHDDVVYKLLACGADPDLHAGSSTALHFCIIQNRFELACLLLEHNANPDLRDPNGKTPLSLACEDGQAEYVELLLRCNADTSIKNNNHQTPLSVARESKEPSADLIIDMLLQVGAKE